MNLYSIIQVYIYTYNLDFIRTLRLKWLIFEHFFLANNMIRMTSLFYFHMRFFSYPCNRPQNIFSSYNTIETQLGFQSVDRRFPQINTHYIPKVKYAQDLEIISIIIIYLS